MAGGAPEWIGVHPSGKFAYLANDNDTAVDVYAINSTTGVLTNTGSAYACINSLRTPGVASGFDPSGKFLYVPQGCSFDNVLTFSVNQTNGALTLANTSNGSLVWLAVHPMGNFVYGLSGNAVAIYGVNPTSGMLMTVGTANTGSMPAGIAIDPTGQFLYVANSGSNDVYEYSINPTTGTLSPLGVVGGLSTPAGITIERSGKFLYVLNGQDAGCAYGTGGSVQSFSVATSGD